jgi:hypothetical protein
MIQAFPNDTLEYVPAPENAHGASTDTEHTFEDYGVGPPAARPGRV